MVISLSQRWLAPTSGHFKLKYSDAAVKQQADYVGIGEVIRDSDGVVHACLAKRIRGRFMARLVNSVNNCA
ncbi:hypothetical protein L484_009111 [Morus notabilis]|uniref:Uncharacterized protein n=1 Tax=Morus notabilis TaxID=981085 RepID=W9QYQ1_9ROSA|nr:hypothetical protein L484_009111 [Morus notabilis]